MCSWCHAFAPVWAEVRERVKDEVVIKNVLGGLAPDTDVPMPDEMRQYLKSTWQRIETVVPGTVFNYDFWERCEPRRSTYPACRAVIAARLQGQQHEEPMITAIQNAYYREAKNPSLSQTLIEIAGEIGLDADEFADVLDSDRCQKALLEDIALARSLSDSGFPNLVLMRGQVKEQIEFDYNDARATARRINGACQ